MITVIIERESGWEEGCEGERERKGGREGGKERKGGREGGKEREE